jgi:O-antigen ligase
MTGLPAVPFLVLLAVLPFPHTVALRLACLALAFAVAVLGWRRYAVPPVPCRVPIALWALVSLLSLVWAVDRGYTLSELWNEIGYTIMAYLAFFAFTRSAALLRALILALGAGAAVLCAWAIARYAVSGDWDDAAGHGGVGNFAAYAVSVVPALLVLAVGTRPMRIAAAVVFALVAVASVLSAQRILWPVLAVQIVAVLWLAQANGLLRIPARTVVIAAFGAVVFAGSVLLVAQSERYEANRGAPAKMVDADTRWRNWPHVVDRILEHPWHGVGFGRQVMTRAYRDLIPADNPMFWHAHNTVLNYGLSMGLPGIAALLLLFAGFAREYWRLLRDDDRLVKVIGIAGIALLLGVFLRNQVNDFLVRDMAILFWALNGAFLGLGARLRAARGAT